MPLSAVQVSPAQLQQEVAAQQGQGARLVRIERTDEQGKSICIAHRYKIIQTLTVQVDGAPQTRKERRLLVQSMAAAHASLQVRLQQAQQALQELTARRQGKARLLERAAVKEAIQDVLTRFRVEGLLRVQIQEHVQQREVAGLSWMQGDHAPRRQLYRKP